MSLRLPVGSGTQIAEEKREKEEERRIEIEQWLSILDEQMDGITETGGDSGVCQHPHDHRQDGIEDILPVGADETEQFLIEHRFSPFSPS